MNSHVWSVWKASKECCVEAQKDVAEMVMLSRLLGDKGIEDLQPDVLDLIVSLLKTWKSRR